MVHSRRAFTLIELALVLVVLSLMTGFGMQAFQSNSTLDCYLRTEDQIQAIDRALQNFAASNSRLPKPASLAYGSNNPSFGVEQTGGVATNHVNYATTIPAGMSNSGGVLIGALPVATLGLPVSYASDCWGDKYTYAVTNALTSSNSTNGYPSGAAGAITVRANDSTALSSLASYVVVSHGQDKFGATPLSAGDIAARNCTGTTSDKIDRHNCDFNNAVFYNAVRNTGASAAAGYFDDVLAFSAKTQFLNDCAGQTYNWGAGCTASTSAINHGSNATVSNTAGGYTGSVTLTCNAGTLSPSGASCTASAPCNTQATSWMTNCSASSGAQLASGASRSVTNTAVNYTGSSTITCTNGVLSHSASTCTGTASCAAHTANWTVSGQACAGPAGALAHNASASVSNTNSGKSGSVTVTCNNGTPSQSGASCVSTTNNCASQAVSWSGSTTGCSVTVGALTHGASTGVTNSAAGKTGSGTASCNNGTTTVSGTCYNNCTAATKTWSTNCSASHAAMNHGAVLTSVANTAAGYTGAADLTCSNGTVTTSNTTCNQPQPAPNIVYCSSTTTGPMAAVAGTSNFSSLTNGDYHLCALDPGGKAYCWGSTMGNGSGQLGTGNNTNYTTPTAVSGGLTFRKIYAKGSFTCGITQDNDAYCWGWNGYSQLGDGTTTARNVPTLVSGGHKWLALGTSTMNTCGVRTDGRLYCWGEVINGAAVNYTTPTAMLGSYTYKEVVPGQQYGCALETAGTVRCWGANGSGNYGNGTTTAPAWNTTNTYAGAGGMTFTQLIGSGPSYCGLTSAGQAYCWGWNGNAQLGDGSTTTRTSPVAVSGGLTFSSLSTDRISRFCGVTTAGALYCWGGSGSVSAPALVASGFPTFQYASVGQGGSPSYAGICGVTGVPIPDGSLYCMSGGNTFAQEPSTSTYSNFDMSGDHMCALSSAGAVTCWGQNDTGQLGNASTTDSLNTPVAVNSAQVFRQVSTGGYSWGGSCGVTTSDAGYCWGYNQYGQLGDGTTTSPRTSPTLVAGGHSWNMIDAGQNYSCGIRTDGALYCWGTSVVVGNYGASPRLIDPGPYKSVSVSDYWTACALKNTGQAMCWGPDNQFGDVGDGTTNNSFGPQAVAGGYTFKTIYSYNQSSCGITTAGVTYCWGRNNNGQLGDGTTTTPRSSPSLVAGSVPFVSASGKSYQSGFLSPTGKAYFAGLGWNDSAVYSTPVLFWPGNSNQGWPSFSKLSVKGGTGRQFGANANKFGFGTFCGMTGTPPAECNAQAVTWSTNCSTTTAIPLLSGERMTVRNTASGYSGTVILSCTDGVLTQLSPSCAAAANVTGVCGTANNGNFSFSPSSNLCTAGTATSVGGVGPWYWNCTGSGTGATASCSAHKICAAETHGWNTAQASGCSAPVAAGNHGTVTPLTNTVVGKSGTTTVTCIDGNWVRANPVCTSP